MRSAASARSLKVSSSTPSIVIGPLFPIRCSNESRPDVDLGRERPVNRALVRDHDEARPLLVAQTSLELDVALDAIEHAALRLTIRAVCRMDLGVPKPHRDGLERPLLSTRVKRNRHRGACAKGGDEKAIRIRTRVRAAEPSGFVGQQRSSWRPTVICFAKRFALPWTTA